VERERPGALVTPEEACLIRDALPGLREARRTGGDDATLTGAVEAHVRAGLGGTYEADVEALVGRLRGLTVMQLVAVIDPPSGWTPRPSEVTPRGGSGPGGSSGPRTETLPHRPRRPSARRHRRGRWSGGNGLKPSRCSPAGGYGYPATERPIALGAGLLPPFF
jgi:hypothetical protein